MARKATDIGKIEFARSPTPGRGLALDERGKVNYELLKDAPADGNTLKYVVDSTSSQGRWTADSGREYITVGQKTGDQIVSATAASGAASVITLSAQTYRAEEVLVELSLARVQVGAHASGNTLYLQLWYDSTRLGWHAINVTGTTDDFEYPVYARWLHTPAAGSHTYEVKAHRSNANCTIYAANVPADDNARGLLSVKYTGR